MFHISDCKKYTRCPRLFLYEQNAEKSEYHPFVRLDEKVTDLAMEKLHIKKEEAFIGKTGDDPKLSLQALGSYEWLVQARFAYDNLRVKVPFLHRNNEAWDIYFLYTGIWPHGEDLQYYCDTVWVLRNNNIQINNMYIIHLNASYERKKDLDPEGLFTISEYFYNSNNHPSTHIRTQVEKNMHDLKPLLESMEKADPEHVGKPVRERKCSGRVKCRYYETCFPHEEKEADNSILTLIASRYRYDMKNKGILYLKDADISQIEGTRQQYAQIMADKNNGLYVDKYGLHTWLSHISYPVSFLDFEWERFAIPPYEGMHPYDVLPFEYALYILQEDGTMSHYVYLNVHDDRYDMASSLCEKIPAEGSVIAYNAEGAEMQRINEFARLFPDLSERLNHINERMEDLQLPFENGTVYDTRMRGSWSLKTIMNMMDDPGYRDLDIRQGMDAVWQWRHLDYNDAPIEEQEKIVEDLKKYCGMDAYAMTVVFKWLKTLVK